MIVHRFMSDKEYQRLIAGETLTNHTQHNLNGWATTSIGFCFFTEPPHEAIHWLSFIVDTDWCVTFDIPDNMLTEAKAKYHKVDKDTERKPLIDPTSCWRTEYCLTKYSIRQVKIINATDEYESYGQEIKNLLRTLINEIDF